MEGGEREGEEGGKEDKDPSDGRLQYLDLQKLLGGSEILSPSSPRTYSF